jgi:tripartite ATP-independent transporter DctP family solute receptor
MKPIRPAALVLAGLLAASSSTAADIRDRTIKIGTVLNADHPQGQALIRFAELVTQKSDGKMQAKNYFGGTLGNDVSMTQALQGGIQEVAIPECSTLVSIQGLKEFGLLNLPRLFNDSREADAVLDGGFGQKLLAKLPQAGLIGLGLWENGFRHATNSRKPITKLEDFAGLKIRVLQNPLLIDTFTALGANAVPMAWTEVYPALESKAIDGQENPLATILSSKIYEVQKHAVLSGHVYSVWALLLSKKFWDRLTPDEQKIITEAANETKDYQRKTMRAYEAKALEELKAKGLQVTTLSEADMTKMNERLKPVWTKFSKEFGEGAANELLGDLKKVRSEKK